MAEWRPFQTKFFLDSEVLMDFTPEDRYFYIVLLLNPKTSACGVYEISIPELSLFTGYTRDSIELLIERFIEKGKIKYDYETHEVAVLNWLDYHVPRSPKIQALIKKEIEKIKSPEFANFVIEKMKSLSALTGYEARYIRKDTQIKSNEEQIKANDSAKAQGKGVSDTLSKKTGGDYRQETRDKRQKTISLGQVRNLTEPSSNSSDLERKVSTVIAHLNERCHRRFSTSKGQAKYARARIRDDSASVEDLKLIVDFKAAEWLGDERMKRYLRPATLWSAEHFEDYLDAARQWDKQGRPSLSANGASENRAQVEELLRAWQQAKQEYHAQKKLVDSGKGGREAEHRLAELIDHGHQLRAQLSRMGVEPDG